MLEQQQCDPWIAEWRTSVRFWCMHLRLAREFGFAEIEDVVTLALRGTLASLRAAQRQRAALGVAR